MSYKPENFDLEKRTTEFAKRIIRLCKEIPVNVITAPIIGQLVRSGGSIGANYREANDALGRKDFTLRVRTARKEAKETLHWLETLVEAYPQLKTEIRNCIKECTEIKNILSAIIQKMLP